MQKYVYYLYLCDSGTLLTTAKIDGIPHTKKYRLVASTGHQITKDGANFYSDTFVSENEIDKWYEVEAG